MRTITRTGYTVLELILVLVVMAIVGAIAVPRVKLGRFYADEGMRRLQGVLQQAQRSAIMRQTDVMVSFDTAGRRVRVLLDVNDNHQVDAGETVRWFGLDDGTRFAMPPVGVQCGGAPVCGSNIVSRNSYPTIYFRRDGAVNTDAEIYVRSNKPDLNDFRALHVTQATGRVDLYHYGAGSWQPASQ